MQATGDATTAHTLAPVRAHAVPRVTIALKRTAPQNALKCPLRRPHEIKGKLHRSSHPFRRLHT